MGSPLLDIVNKKAAIIKDYRYSKSLVDFKKNWTRLELLNFLERSKQYTKGTNMIYKGLKKADDRINLVSFLDSLK